MSETAALPEKKGGGEEGAPGWIMTFADLMSLLLAFFVLLLSFSELDLSKYKKIAGSMEKAFGVQRQVQFKDIPKGTSIIAREFTPGKPQPTLEKTVQQRSIPVDYQTLEFTNSKRVSEGQQAKGARDLNSDTQTASSERSPAVSVAEQSAANEQLAAQQQRQMEARFDEVFQALLGEVTAGLIDLDLEDGRLIIRIRERGSFAAGSARPEAKFLPVLERIAAILERLPGTVIISGHSDSTPVRGTRYRSNWELSAARAAAVADELLAVSAISPKRLLVEGRADTRPLKDETTAANRAANRRVEIAIDMYPRTGRPD